MSAAEVELQGVEGYTHPEWCDLDKCEPALDGKPSGVHYSTGFIWGLQSDEAEFMIELIRSDDRDVRTGENRASTELKVTLQQMIADGDDPRCGCYADAWVTPEDARMLIQALTRYVDLAERSNRFDHELKATQLPRRKRTF